MFTDVLLTASELRSLRGVAAAGGEMAAPGSAPEWADYPQLFHLGLLKYSAGNLILTALGRLVLERMIAVPDGWAGILGGAEESLAARQSHAFARRA